MEKDCLGSPLTVNGSFRVVPHLVLFIHIEHLLNSAASKDGTFHTVLFINMFF